jgi:hypothetical protein
VLVETNSHGGGSWAKARWNPGWALAHFPFIAVDFNLLLSVGFNQLLIVDFNLLVLINILILFNRH